MPVGTSAPLCGCELFHLAVVFPNPRVIGKFAAAMEARKRGTGSQARASFTDPEARKMKMADGGFSSLADITRAEQAGV